MQCDNDAKHAAILSHRHFTIPPFYHSDKTKTQPFWSQLKQWNLSEEGVVSLYSKRRTDIPMYDSFDADMVHWHTFQEFMEELQPVYTSGQWRVFHCSSKVSLKAVLLHNGNTFPSVPLALAVHMQEMRENLQDFMQKNTLWISPVEYMCWPNSYSNGDCAAKRIQ